jgi:D-beta-D-heptose 7-phosphate kinase/D-beta-D-heptose 1-phosphate adenosyltransferase
MPTLIDHLDRWQPTRIVVAGDFMLDRYAYGNASRLSPDAPVPVLAVERTESLPGGSANVCLDLAALRCKVACLGIVGDDEPGQTLSAALRENEIDTRGLLTVAGRPTTVKHNLVGLAQHRHPQKMFRLDTEDRSALPPEVCDRLLEQADALLEHCDILCLEDYNKGLLSESVCQGLITKAAERDIAVLVDPAAISDYRKYRGAACITPNRTEAQLATGQDEPEAMARQLKADLNLSHVVLTLDKSGALLLDESDVFHAIPTVARSVYDVTGAGDMVLAMLAAARANGIDWPDSVALANVAAGLEVEKAGVVPIPLDEILLALLEDQHRELGKVRGLEQLLPELQAYRQQGRRIVFTNGCFDILHAGHVAYLREARKQGDLLVVGLNSDDSIRSIKGPDRPVNHQDDRLLVLSELQSVDYLVVFGEDTPIKLIEAIRPDVLAKGADYAREQVVGHKIVEAHGGEVALIDLVEGRSTTNIIRKLQDHSVAD